jgi:Xaa-Pro dipeptidase
MIFPLSEYERRWRAAGQALDAQGLHAAVVWGRTASSFDRAGDVIWLTNYFSTKAGQGYDAPPHNARAYCAVILRAGQTPELIADDPDIRSDTVAVDNFRSAADPVAAVVQSLKQAGDNGRIGFVGTDFFPMKYWQELVAATPDLVWQPCDRLVRDIRLVKSPAELDIIREGGRIASSAMSSMMDALVAGKPETEAAARAAYEVVNGGGVVDKIQISQGESIGYTCGDPMAGYRAQAGKAGDLVRAFLIGPMFQGYYFDPGRTAVVGGKANADQANLIDACIGIVEALEHFVKPGISFLDAGKLGDQLVAEFGPDEDPAAEKFPFFGHVQGLYFESPPYISATLDHGGQIFEEGMMIGLEAFLARKGVGNAGFEQNYIVVNDGVELLTTTPLRWH